MQNDYKTILATCLRLKDVVVRNLAQASPQNPWYYNSACQALPPLLQEVTNLITVIPKEFDLQKQFIALDYANCFDGVFINYYGVGSLARDLDNLDVMVGDRPQSNLIVSQKQFTKTSTCKKIFISHSSKDISIVDAFVTLLTRGAGLLQDDIFCSSLDGMKIKNGEDMRKHIQENVNYADFAILLVSKNYKASEVCLNEMGAVWAIDKKVKAYVFPDLQEERVGWLINDKAAEKLNDETALASLYEELQQFYKLPLSLPGWTAQAKAFCGKFNVDCRTP